jgi:hypothetical protein
MKGRINIRNLREIPDGDRGMYSSVTWPCIEFLDVLTRKPLDESAMEVFGTAAIHRNFDEPARFRLRVDDEGTVYAYNLGIRSRLSTVYEVNAPLLYVADEFLTVQEPPSDCPTMVLDRHAVTDRIPMPDQCTWLCKLCEDGSSVAANRFASLLYVLAH